MKVEPRAEGQSAASQNGGAERAGQMIIRIARALHLATGLPESLANELAVTALYLINRAPTRSLGWKTPFEIVHGSTPSAAHMTRIGLRVFALNEHLKKGDKLKSRALIGHLIGFDSLNIYRVWLPTTGKILRTKDVVF